MEDGGWEDGGWEEGPWEDGGWEDRGWEEGRWEDGQTLGGRRLGGRTDVGRRDAEAQSYTQPDWPMVTAPSGSGRTYSARFTILSVLSRYLTAFIIKV